jgi:DNA-directed RNA polymerase subunit M/transcription elongation factor TFIIS
MYFCSVCENMYYTCIDSENSNSLIYYCRHCGNEDKILTVDKLILDMAHLKNDLTKQFY